MHSVIASSAAPRWGHCAGSILMEAQHPDRESEEAAEGTAAHWVMEKALRNALTDMRPPDCQHWHGLTAPNGVVVNDEMVAGAHIMCDDVWRTAKEHAAFNKLLIEHRGVAPNLIHPLQGGTLDVALPLIKQRKVYLWDFKFGHLVVEHRDNYQAVCYYAQLVEELGIDGIMDQHIDVHIRICQPRAFHREGSLREWVVKASDLRAYINRLHNQAHDAMRENAPTVAGPWCRDCKARHDCSTAGRAAQHAMSIAGQSERDGMTPEEMAYELAMLKDAAQKLEARRTGIEQHIGALLDSGEAVPGWALERPKGRQRIKPEHEETVKFIGRSYGKEVTKTTLKTPKQIAATGIDMDILSEYIETPLGSPRVVESDQTIAHRAFNRR